jgi:hypothetical protein
MSRTRFEISIKYTDSKGIARYANNVGNVWLDLEQGRGSIDLPPGVALVGGQVGVFINVSLPRPREGGAPRPQQGKGFGGYLPTSGAEDDGSDVPF